MRVVRIATSNGIDNIKLIAETEDDAYLIRQLANAGTLTSISNTASNSVEFQALAIGQSVNPNVISRGEIGKYNFSVRQNQTENFALTFNRDGVPVDLSLYSAIKLCVKHERNSSAVITLALTQGLTISGDSLNTLNITLTDQQTAILCRPRYYYDIMLDNGAEKLYWVEGTIHVNKSVTR